MQLAVKSISAGEIVQRFVQIFSQGPGFLLEAVRLRGATRGIDIDFGRCFGIVKGQFVNVQE